MKNKARGITLHGFVLHIKTYGKDFLHNPAVENLPLSYSIHKINSKWIEDLNVRSETIKILEESIHARLWDISISDGVFFFFWILMLKTETTKAKINKRDYINLKSICTVKKTVKKMKIYEWEKIFANYISNKE